MADLRFGTGGVPLSVKDRSVISGINRLVELELDHMEVEFVHGVRMKREPAEQAGALAAEKGITLTCHGPYYINLNSEDAEKCTASVRRILEDRPRRTLAGGEEYHLPSGLHDEKKPRGSL